MSFIRRPLLIFLVLVFWSCSSDSPTDPGPGSGPEVRSLALPSQTARAGESYEYPDLDDLELTKRAGIITAQVGGESAPILMRADGTPLLSIPLFLDEATLWSAPPAEPVAVEILEDGIVIARTAPELTVQPLEEADGTAMAMVTDLGQWLDDMESLFESLPFEPSAGEAYATALVPALRQIVDLDATHSLGVLLGDMTPAEIRLLDATLKSANVDASFTRLRDGLDDIQGGGGGESAKLSPLADGCGTVMLDSRLAELMQFASWASAFSTDFVSEVSSTLSGVSGGIGLVLLADLTQEVPLLGNALSIANLIIGLVDVLVNKVLVALMPTSISDLTLEVEDTLLNVDDETFSTMTVCATNQPPAITINDIVAQVINLAAVVSPGGPATIRNAVETVVFFLLEQINNAISSYLSANPGLQINTELLEVPTMQWHARILDSKWIVQMSSAPDVFEILEPEAEWKALDVGTSTASFRPATGSNVQVVDGYAGGAFGNDVFASNEVELSVSGLVLQVEMAATIPGEGAAVLGAKAGHTVGGEILWEEGILIDLTIDGAAGDPAAGSTDADGDFVSVITPNPGAVQVEVVVTASDQDGNEVEETVTAVVERTSATLEIRSSLVAVTSRETDNGTVICDDNQRDSFLLPGPWDGSKSGGCGGASGTATQTSSVTTRDQIPALPELLVATAEGTVSVAQGFPDRFNAGSSFAIAFRVRDGHARLRGNYSLQFPMDNGTNPRGKVILTSQGTQEVLLENRFNADGVEFDILLPPSEETYTFLIRSDYIKDGYTIQTGDVSFELSMELVESAEPTVMKEARPQRNASTAIE